MFHVDEFLGCILDILGGNGFHDGIVIVDDVVAAFVEAIAAHDLAHPETVVLFCVLAVDDLLLLNFGEGFGIGTFVDVFFKDFESGILDKVGGVGFLVGVLCQILSKSGREEQALLMTVTGMILVLLLVVGQLGELIASGRQVFGL